MLRLHLLGDLRMELDEEEVQLQSLGRKGRLLLAMLALDRRLHGRSELAGRLWPDVREDSARVSLRTALSQLRTALGSAAESALRAERDGGIALGAEVWTDVGEVDRLLSKGDAEAALERCRSELLSGLDDDWVLERRDELRDRLAHGLEAQAAAAEATGDLDAAIRLTRRIVALDPLAETAHRELMRRLAAAADRGAALRVYEQLRGRLAEQLRVAPSAATRELAERIRSEETEFTPPPLPGPLCAASSLPFVGRTAEVAAVMQAWMEACREGRRIVLVPAEPGCGKTRLAWRVSVDAHRQGAVVLYGSCDAHLTAPFQPFVEALSRLVDAVEPAVLSRLLGPRGGELARLLPDLGRRVPDLPPPAPGDAASQRHRLHTAALDLLQAIARARPLLLVLDDVHWADAGSLGLLEHLARAAGEARLMIVATYRPEELDGAGSLATTVAELHRHPGVKRVPLGGLRPHEVEELVRDLGGSPSPQELASALHDQTGGNAFLLGELWRHLGDTGALAQSDDGWTLTEDPGRVASPHSVRHVMGERLERLTPPTRRLLEIVAALARPADVPLLRAATAQDDSELLPALDEAVAAGVLDELPGLPVSYRFHHELLRRAVTDRMGALHRARLHVQAAQALERHLTADRGQLSAELAYHWTEAVPVAGPAPAVRASIEAADAAERSLAFDEVARLLRTALALGVEGDDRMTVELRLGQALHHAGETAAALEQLVEAASLARELSDDEAFARAAIAFEEARWKTEVIDDRAVELLREADRRLGGEDSGVRARVLACLTAALVAHGRRREAEAPLRDAVAMARRVGDRRALAHALAYAEWARSWLTDEEVVASMSEAAGLADALGDSDLRARIAGARVRLLIELYDLEGARRELSRMRTVVERVGQPFARHGCAIYGASLAICDGCFAEAEAFADAALESHRLLGREASAAHGIQLFTIRREQGRLREVAPLARLLAGDPGGSDAWGPALAALYAALGMTEATAAELQRICGRGIVSVAPGPLRLGVLGFLSDACDAVGDPHVARLVYEQLRPFEGRNVIVGEAVVCYGAADRFLGSLARIAGDREAALRHLEAALELNARLGAVTWLAHTRFELARAMLDSGDRQRARALLGAAREAARRHGMAALDARMDLLEDTGRSRVVDRAER